MKTEEYCFKAEIPSVEEYGKNYPNRLNFAVGEGKEIFDTIMTAESCLRCKIFTDNGNPAVTGVADACVKYLAEIPQPDRDFRKRFIGTVVCTLMEANGYKKTGIRKAIPHDAFSRGEFYEKTTG